MNARSEDLPIDIGYVVGGLLLIIQSAALTMHHHGWLPVTSAVINTVIATRTIDKGVFRIRRAHREARKDKEEK